MGEDLPTAAMTFDEFEGLPEYSCSVPTGGKIGKRWKRRQPYFDGPEPHEWFLGEYVDIGSETEVGVTWSQIVIDPGHGWEPHPTDKEE